MGLDRAEVIVTDAFQRSQSLARMAVLPIPGVIVWAISPVAGVDEIRLKAIIGSVRTKKSRGH